MSSTPASPFGTRLREWRRLRGLTQLELASRAGTTTRHLSYLENGRSRPSQQMVLRLSEVIEVPLRQRNDLLESAGLSAVFPQHRFDASDLAPYRAGVQRLLDAHDPFPGLVFDSRWHVLMANAGAVEFFGEGIMGASMIDWMLTSGPTIVNREETTGIALARLRQQVNENPADTDLRTMVTAAEAQLGPDVGDSPPGPVVCPTFLVGDRHVSLIGLAARFEAPTDVTIAELRIELFFPADAESDAYFRSAEHHIDG